MKYGYVEKPKKRKLKSSVKVITVVILMVFLCVGILLIYKGFNPNKTNLKAYSVNESEDISYKVYLKENTFYAEKYLEMDKQYPSNLIDHIDIDFDYLFNGSDLIDLDYSYSIDASIVGEYESSNVSKTEIWHKDYIILDKVNDKINDSNNFNVKKNVIIDYAKYNNIVNQFKTNFKLAIDAYLDVTLKIDYIGVSKKNNIDVKDNKKLELIIPLTSNTFKITHYEDANSRTISNDVPVDIDLKLIVVGLILALFNIIIFIIFYFKFIKKYKSEYYKRVDKLLKDYSEIIIEISTPLEISEDLTILDIANFDDMVDIEEEIKSPIMLYEVEKGKESWFVIAYEDKIYRYILK